MSWFTNFTSSSIGKKLIMALTGLFLISFLLVHCAINATIFVNDGGETFNKAAHFMGTNILIRTMEIGLFLGLILHVVQGFSLFFKNKGKRPVGYAVATKAPKTSWYSKSMGLLGTIILLFLVVHLVHFWVPSRITGLEEVMIDGEVHHNLYIKMAEVFQSPIAVLIYVLGVISLAYHLMHGFQSAFQTFGLNHPKYTPLIKACGTAFSIIIPLLFAAMPLAFHFGMIK